MNLILKLNLLSNNLFKQLVMIKQRIVQETEEKQLKSKDLFKLSNHDNH